MHKLLAKNAGLLLWFGCGLVALATLPVSAVALAQEGGDTLTVAQDGKIIPPRPHPGDVMRHWPVYPEDALSAGIEGTVIVRLQVTATGQPEDISVQQSSGVTSLDVTAVAAVSRWQFDAGKRDGVAETMTVSLPIRFSLPKQTDEASATK